MASENEERTGRYSAALQSAANYLWKRRLCFVNRNLCPCRRFSLVRLWLAIAGQKGWIIKQLDYKNVFIHANIDIDVYMHFPQFMERGADNQACLLQRSLHGLKGAPKIWYSLLKSELSKAAFNPWEVSYASSREGVYCCFLMFTIY